jgi:hypothetical protein
MSSTGIAKYAPCLFDVRTVVIPFVPSVSALTIGKIFSRRLRCLFPSRRAVTVVGGSRIIFHYEQPLSGAAVTELYIFYMEDSDVIVT